MINMYFQGHIPCSSLVQGLPLTLEMVAVPMTWSHFGCGESIGWGHSIVFGQVPIMSATVARFFPRIVDWTPCFNNCIPRCLWFPMAFSLFWHPKTV